MPCIVCDVRASEDGDAGSPVRVLIVGHGWESCTGADGEAWLGALILDRDGEMTAEKGVYREFVYLPQRSLYYAQQQYQRHMHVHKTATVVTADRTNTLPTPNGRSYLLRLAHSPQVTVISEYPVSSVTSGAVDSHTTLMVGRSCSNMEGQDQGVFIRPISPC